MAALYPRWVRLLLAAAAAIAPLAAAGSAHASDPSYTILTVPGDGGPTSAYWNGAALSGHPDPSGPPATECVQGQCDQEQLIPISRDPNYTKKHVLTLTVWITYSSSGNNFDLALLDRDYNLVKAITHVASGQKLAVSGIRLDNYYAQIDSDIQVAPTSYVGHVVLTATSPPPGSTVPTPHPSAAPPVSSSIGNGVGGPGANSVGATVGPGANTATPGASGSPSRIGAIPPIPPNHPVSSSSGLGKWWLLIGAGIVGAIWFASKVLRRT